MEKTKLFKKRKVITVRPPNTETKEDLDDFIFQDEPVKGPSEK